ncbi:Sarcoglycan alpha [Carabus blaptoides fortunei]
MTEVFAIPIEPALFNWTFEVANDQFVYQPSLLNAPDLPSWVNYVYSDRHHTGFLYGVPPNEHREVKIDIIALNRFNYETRRYILPIQVTEKLNPAQREVQMKIDNLNVQDMFDVERMERLKDIFRKKLWRDSQNDLYVTFLASAVKLGARLPLKPNEGEGVVLRIGSIAVLSNELIELQEEVKPLWKVPSCPRDFKRTTVERLFRENGFALDWCTFRLLEDRSDNEELVNSMTEEVNVDRWISVARSEVPVRSYAHELVFTILVPVFIMVVLVVLLSMILCFQHDELEDPISEAYFQSLYHICIDYVRSKETDTTSFQIPTANSTLSTPKPTHTLHSLTHQSEVNCLSPESMVISRSRTNSPNSCLIRASSVKYLFFV